MNVLVDIGNTRIKWCVDTNKGLNNTQAVIYQQTDFIKQIQQAWLKIDTPEKLVIACVSKKLIADQLIELAKAMWHGINVVVAKSSPYGFSVTNAYSQGNKLGVDRWLGLIALRYYYPGNSCIVDCGTAITLDALDAHGQHLGGLICPGLQLMKQSLFKGTEALSRVEQEYSVGLANFTESAIYSGTLYAAAGLIEKAIAELCTCQTIILTGGDAMLLVEYLDLKAIIEPDFILKGLSLYCKGDKLK